MLEPILDFILECEKLKAVDRKVSPAGLTRKENSAEHSWSAALLAAALIPAVDRSLDSTRILKMLLIHDLVEIDAGDTFCYDFAGHEGKVQKEREGASRIFGILPEEIGSEFLSLWEEFEANETKEAAFANALDRLLPLLQNRSNGGGTWTEYGITYDQVYRRILPIRKSSPLLWDYCLKLIQVAEKDGLLRPDPA